MTKYAKKKKVFSKSDLPKSLKAGDIHNYFGSRIKVRDLNYRNQYGEFILCDTLYDSEEKARVDQKWDIQTGIAPHVDNPYEVLHTLEISNGFHLPSTVGYLVMERCSGEKIGLSYKQTWELIFHKGAVNAEATVSKFGPFTSYLLDSIDELPAFNSSYWQISPYDKNGKLLFPLTKEVKKELERSLERAIKEGIQHQIKKLSSVQTELDIEDLDKVAVLIRESANITVLTGAGISTMSGIPDYRSAAAGVWLKKPDLLMTLNQQTFVTNPEQFWESYYDLFAVTLSEIIPYQTGEAVVTAIDLIQPNEGHHFFARLEEMGKTVTILTQNVDGLHQKAGSKTVLEIHGNVGTCSCPSCGEFYQLKEVFAAGRAPRSRCGAVLRPDVVFFGDAVRAFDQAEEAVSDSDLIIVAGTSLQVAPFNQLPRLAALNEVPIVYINGEAPEEPDIFDYMLLGNISEICRMLED